MAHWEHSCYEVQGRSTIFDKILTEKEKYSSYSVEKAIVETLEGLMETKFN
jgi:hypothetical protein